MERLQPHAMQETKETMASMSSASTQESRILMESVGGKVNPRLWGHSLRSADTSMLMASAIFRSDRHVCRSSSLKSVWHDS